MIMWIDIFGYAIYLVAVLVETFDDTVGVIDSTISMMDE